MDSVYFLHPVTDAPFTSGETQRDRGKGAMREQSRGGPAAGMCQGPLWIPEAEIRKKQYPRAWEGG